MLVIVRTMLWCCLVLAASVCHAQSVVTGPLVTIGKPTANVAIREIADLEHWNGESTIDVGQVVRFGNPELIEDDGVVLFDDGTRIVAKELHTQGNLLHGYTRLWDEITLPLRPLRGILLRAHPEVDQTQLALDRIQAYEGTRDRLALINGDHVEGTFRRLTALDVEFQVGKKLLTLERSRVGEILFAKTAGNLPLTGQGVWVGLRDGSLLLVDQMKLHDERLQVRLPSGVSLKSSVLENAYMFVTYLRPVGSGVRYLSDLEAIGFKNLGFLSTQWDYKKDRNVQGGTLKSDRYVSQKGIGMHATSRLAYKVEPDDSRFKAKVGVDDDTKGAGSVVFKVYTSQTGKDWKVAYESPIVRGGEAPKDVDVSVKGMKGIALVVEFADGADVLDHANWLDARFEPE
ncbi:hypothetical protein GCM10023155_13350 [Bremerella cremea]